MRTAIAVLLMLLAMPAMAQEWSRYSISDEGDVHYLDFTTIRVNGHLRRVWTLANYPTPAGRSRALSSRTLEEVDCREGRLRTLSMAAFSEPMGRGRVLASIDTPYAWEFAAPGSITEALLKLACAAKD